MSQTISPFTPQQVARIIDWQTSGKMHPLTCCDHTTMAVGVNGLVCYQCGGVQDWVPSCVVDMPSDRVLMPRTIPEDEEGLVFRGACVGHVAFSAGTTECKPCEGDGYLVHEGGRREDCSSCDGSGEVDYNLAVPFETIKKIYAMAVKHFEKESGAGR